MSGFHTTDYDEKLLHLDIYSKYPEMLPFIGKDFESMKKKVLILGESHYLPETSEKQLLADYWYQANHLQLDKEEKEWINTRGVINERKGSGKDLVKKAYTIHHNIEKAVSNVGFVHSQSDNLFRYFAYYNYFLRPAQTGISIDRVHIDKERAFYHLNVLIDYFQIDVVIFSSVMAYDDYNWFYKTYNCKTRAVIYSLPHASTPSWNTPSKKYQNEDGKELTGREYFEYILIKEGVSQPS